MRLANVGKWRAAVWPDPKAKTLGTFSVTVTEMRAFKAANGKERIELHGEIDAKLISVSGDAPDVDLHARF